MADEERDDLEEPQPPLPAAGPRAIKTTMPPPMADPGLVAPHDYGKVAPEIPVDVTGPIRRARPPWPGEAPVTPEEEELEPDGDPAMRARKFGDRGTDKDRVFGEQFARDQD